MTARAWTLAGVAVALAVLAGTALWFRGGMLDAQRALAVAKADVETLRTSNAAHEKALDRLADALAANDAALAERESLLRALSTDRDAMRKAWREAIRNDQTVRDWDGLRHPADVNRVLAAPPAGGGGA